MLEKSKRKNKNVLIVSNVPPLEDIGGGIRTIQLIKMLTQKDINVSLMIIYPSQWGPLQNEWIEKAKNICNLLDVLYFDIKKALRINWSIYRKLSSYKKDYDEIIFRFQPTAFISGFYLLGKQTIIDYDDFYLPVAKGVFSKLKALMYVLFANFFIKNAIVLEEKHLIYFKSKGVYVPNIPLNGFKTAKKFEKHYSLEPTLLFVGARTEWIKEFLDLYWHVLKNEFPSISINIITRDNDLRSYYDSGPGINVLNNVDDLSLYYQSAWLFVFPSGHIYGTHMKILESLLYKTVVVCSENAIRGYEKINSNCNVIRTVRNNLQLANEITYLLKRKELIEHLSREGYDKAKSLYNFESLSDQFFEKAFKN